MSAPDHDSGPVAGGPAMSTVLIGLGTNLNREYNILLGLANVLEAFRVTRMSSIFETAPVGTRPSPESYLNSCVLAEVDCGRGQLRDRLREIEAGVGRDRTGDGVYRPLDLDILAFGPSAEELEWFPNDAMAAFVAPLAELGFTAEQEIVQDARAVCVWGRADPAPRA